MTENPIIAKNVAIDKDTVKDDSFSLIWFVPFIALAIAIILAINSWQSHGPKVEIYFEKAEGIEPKRTKIRYKNVDVGTVESIKVSDSLASIIVTAELAPEFSEYLSENTKFWVVSPRISLSGISGLSTLVSGVYIEIDPGEPGDEQYLFQGLDVPPLVRSDSKGSSYTLLTQELGSLDVASPVYFKQIKVGEITSYRLAEDKQDIEVTLFVEAPYDELVTDHSRFWNVSGFEAGLGANGLNIELESLNALISGGVAFDSPYIDEGSSAPIPLNGFYILPNRKAVLDGAYVTSYSFMMNFPNQSIRGLQSGSAVEYYGIKVGHVSEINFSTFDIKNGSNQASINVLIDIQPERMAQQQPLDRGLFETRIKSMIKNGLRGQLKSGSLIIGSLYIDLVQTDNITNNELNHDGNYTFIPTIPGAIDQAIKKLASIVDKIDQIPIVKIGDNLSSGLEELNRLITDLNKTGFSANLGNAVANIDDASSEFKAITVTVGDSLKQLQLTLSSVEESIAPDSQLYFELLETLRGVNESADSMRQFTDELNRYPQSLILGK
ncbi:MAG: paraquat-inducible protein B [Cellvibrionaceae bacterium]|jgi:paraquat-inducible protein B